MWDCCAALQANLWPIITDFTLGNWKIEIFEFNHYKKVTWMYHVGWMLIYGGVPVMRAETKNKLFWKKQWLLHTPEVTTSIKNKVWMCGALFRKNFFGFLNQNVHNMLCNFNGITFFTKCILCTTNWPDDSYTDISSCLRHILYFLFIQP